MDLSRPYPAIYYTYSISIHVIYISCILPAYGCTLRNEQLVVVTILSSYAPSLTHSLCVEPSEPSAPSVVSVATTSAELTWDPPSSDNGTILQYRIRLRGLSSVNPVNDSFFEDVFILTDNTTINLTNLEPFSSYVTSVSAFNSIGEGNFSNETSFMTAAGGKLKLCTYCMYMYILYNITCRNICAVHIDCTCVLRMYVQLSFTYVRM